MGIREILYLRQGRYFWNVSTVTLAGDWWAV